MVEIPQREITGKLSPCSKLLMEVFGDSPSPLADYPYLKGDETYTLSIIGEVLNKLPAREHYVLEIRFGLHDGHMKIYDDVGMQINVTRERARSITAKALRKLRHPAYSRRLKTLLYTETRDDRRALAMRDRLYEELTGFFPEAPAFDIVMGIKRSYLKRALRDLEKDNIARLVRFSCNLVMRYCRNCGQVTLPNWDFCSKECEQNYKSVNLACDWCGTIFKRKQNLTIYRLNKLGFKHYYCSKHCNGKALGKRKRVKIP